MNCPKCGAAISGKYCSACGTLLEKNEQELQYIAQESAKIASNKAEYAVVKNNTAEKKKSKAGLFVGIAVAVVAAVALIITLLIHKLGGSDAAKNGGISNAGVQTAGEQTTDVQTVVEQTTEVQTTDAQTTGEQITEEQTTEEQTTEGTAVSDSEKELVMSDDLFDFTFELDGVVYQLPCEYEAFTRNGWSIPKSEFKIDGNSYGSFYMVKDGHEVTVYAYNMSGNVKAVKDCKIGGVECEGKAGVNFVVAKGITVKSSADEIKTAFGIPNDSNSGSDYQSMTYYADDSSYYNSVRFYIFDEGKYSSITIKNFVESDDDKTISNTERPAYLNEYKKPSAMGADLKSSVVKLEGVLYQLPAPVSEFLENGWEVSSQSGDVAAGNTGSISIEKDGTELDLRIVNYSEYQTTVENCAVYEIYVSKYDYGDAQIFFGSESKAITIGTAKADVEAIITDEYYYDEGIDSYYYSFDESKDREFKISILIDKETDKILTITISCKTWKY